VAPAGREFTGSTWLTSVIATELEGKTEPGGLG
jgi:hypothetical protein